MKERVKLTVSGLTADIENGLTRPEIAEKYGLNTQQLAKAMKQAGLIGKKAKKVAFELVDDTVESPTVQQVIEAGYSEQQATDIVSNFSIVS
jgi:transposase-like protein